MIITNNRHVIVSNNHSLSIIGERKCPSDRLNEIYTAWNKSKQLSRNPCGAR